MKVLDLIEVCGLLHISVATGRNRLSNGMEMPPSFRVGRRRLFLESEVHAWLERRAVHADSLSTASGVASRGERK